MIVQLSKLDKLLPKYTNQWFVILFFVATIHNNLNLRNLLNFRHSDSERINSIVLHIDLIRNGISATFDNERPSALATPFLISFNNINVCFLFKNKIYFGLYLLSLFEINLFYTLQTFNISNTKCVRIHDGSDEYNNHFSFTAIHYPINKQNVIIQKRDISYQWLADSCILKKQDKNSALCACMQTGTFAITNEFHTFKVANQTCMYFK